MPASNGYRPSEADRDRWRRAYELKHARGLSYRAAGRVAGVSGVMMRVRCLRFERWFSDEARQIAGGETLTEFDAGGDSDD